MHFNELLTRLPRSSEQPNAESAAQHHALDLHPSAPIGYIKPHLKISNWADGAAALLIEAPGAVGKSAAATALAEALNWPLVLAERAQVGSYSLSGLIHDSLGFESDYMAKVARAVSGLIVDSLDEALFRAGTDNFLAFLENILNICRGAFDHGDVRSPSVILLSRSEAASWVKLVFDNAGVPLAEARLDFFGHAAANDFLRSYLRQRYSLTARPEYNVPLSAPGPYEKLRNQRMQEVARLLLRHEHVDLGSNWGSVAEFLGYAPVLSALGESLAVSNPSASRHTHFDADDQRSLLDEIARSILNREQQKFILNMQDKLRAHTSPLSPDLDLDTLYTDVEQCARLAAVAFELQLVETVPPSLPPELGSIYEESAAQLGQEHPFLRSGASFASVVFADYVRARVIGDSSVASSLQSTTPAVIQHVGPFYARFLLGHKEAEDEIACVPEEYVLSVLSSWEQDQELGSGNDYLNQAHSHITLDEDFGLVVCEGRRDSRESNDTSESLRFHVDNLSGAFSLGARLHRTSFISSAGVLVGERNTQLELGPGTLIVATEICIEASSIRVASDETGVVILATNEWHADYLSRVDADQGSLVVIGDNVPAPLRPFVRGSGDTSGLPGIVHFSEFVDLKKILFAFRPSRHGARAHQEYLDNRTVRDSPFRQTILDDLLERELVWRDGGYYYIETGSLASLGFGLNEAKSGEPSAAILKYLGSLKGSEESKTGE